MYHSSVKAKRPSSYFCVKCLLFVKYCFFFVNFCMVSPQPEQRILNTMVRGQWHSRAKREGKKSVQCTAHGDGTYAQQRGVSQLFCRGKWKSDENKKKSFQFLFHCHYLMHDKFFFIIFISHLKHTVLYICIFGLAINQSGYLIATIRYGSVRSCALS